MTPRVSVITPAYNSAKTLEKSATSVLSQDFTDLELLIIVNGCTDDTMSIAKKISDSDNRVKVLESKKGVVPARNKGIEISKGDIIALQDADDEWLPEKLSKQVEMIDAGFDVVGGQIIRVDTNGFVLKEQIKWPMEHEKIMFSMLNGVNAIANSSAIFRKDLLDHIGTYEDCMQCEDFHMWLKALKFGKFINLPQNVMKYTVTHNPNYDHVIPVTIAAFYKSLYTYTGVYSQ